MEQLPKDKIKGAKMRTATPWQSGGVIFLIGLLAVVGPARGGVYNFAEPPDPLQVKGLSPEAAFLEYWQSIQDRRILLSFAQVRWRSPDAEIRGEEGRVLWEKPFLQRHLLNMQLGSRPPVERLSVEQKLNLSAYLLRCRRDFEAREILEPLTRTEPDNFLVLANLAMAYFQINEFPRAIDYQKLALEVWPERFADLKPEMKKFLDKVGMGQPEYEFYRTVEKTFLKLLQARQAEKGKDYSTVDALFADERGPVRFVSEKGEFDPGQLAPGERLKLPINAMEQVQQLLLWVPYDDRLCWYYGELLAANNRIREAQQVFKEIDKSMNSVPEFRNRHRVLKKAPIPVDPADPKVGDIADLEKKVDDLEARVPYPYRDVVLSFGLGFALALFGYWQFRELRRRHHRPAIAPPPGPGTP